tara:strand:+ start:281 stop:454 length:174 start_codon:yes stop_codon:yes gene_type:complete
LLKAIEATFLETHALEINAVENKGLETKKRQPYVGWRLLLVGAVLEQPNITLSYYID